MLTRAFYGPGFCLIDESFPLSSSGGLRLEVISQRSQKGQERLSEIFALCLSPQGEPPPLFLLHSIYMDVGFDTFF